MHVCVLIVIISLEYVVTNVNNVIRVGQFLNHVGPPFRNWPAYAHDD